MDHPPESLVLRTRGVVRDRVLGAAAGRRAASSCRCALLLHHAALVRRLPDGQWRTDSGALSRAEDRIVLSLPVLRFDRRLASDPVLLLGRARDRSALR